jgi:hypothetical protein
VTNDLAERQTKRCALEMHWRMRRRFEDDLERRRLVRVERKNSVVSGMDDPFDRVKPSIVFARLTGNADSRVARAA